MILRYCVTDGTVEMGALYRVCSSPGSINTNAASMAINLISSGEQSTGGSCWWRKGGDDGYHPVGRMPGVHLMVVGA